MSQPIDLKAEIKKSVLSETVKTVIRLGLLLISVLVLLALPPVRDRIWPATPKWLLAALLVASLLVILGLTAYVTYLRLRTRAIGAELKDVSAEIEALKAKPQYSYRFGIKWDNELNPRCPHCEAPLTSYQYIHLNLTGNVSRFICAGCGREVRMIDEKAVAIRFTDAREHMMQERRPNP